MKATQFALTPGTATEPPFKAACWWCGPTPGHRRATHAGHIPNLGIANRRRTALESELAAMLEQQLTKGSREVRELVAKFLIGTGTVTCRFCKGVSAAVEHSWKSQDVVRGGPNCQKLGTPGAGAATASATAALPALWSNHAQAEGPAYARDRRTAQQGPRSGSLGGEGLLSSQPTQRRLPGRLTSV